MMRGACHCGAVQFTVELTDGINTASRCDCSFCAMRAAVAVTAPKDGITYTKGPETLTLYQFNTKTAKHYFCKICGIYTHHNRRSEPDEIGVNLACLEGQTPYLPEIPVNDGQNHPSDGVAERLAGVLRFQPKENQ